MLTTNQQCNALASIIGIFLHGHNAPEKVAQVLARMGIGISMTAIHDAIISLSRDAEINIRRIGLRRLVAYAYDNFDVHLKSARATIEAAQNAGLKHLTSGMLFSLPLGTQKHDLKWSSWLWQRSRLNDTLPDNRPGIAPIPDYSYVLDTHLQYWEEDDHGLSSQDRWNAWKFLDDLVSYGPEYFHQFRGQVDAPEVIDQVLLMKMQLTPAKAMEIPNSTVQGNIDAIANLLNQGGIGPY